MFVSLRRRAQRLLIEVHARRVGSPLDSTIEVLDAAGKPVGRSTLRCTARTCVVFRDHDSAAAGIRIETWNDLAMDDYVYVGNELLRIQQLPLNPDADCNFYAVGGQRLGFLDTTPGHHPIGAPIYKVEIHPPGTTFPPNGLPVFHLNYRNDDGGPGYGKDSRIFFDPPADGEYAVRVGDAREPGGPEFGYRLTVRPPRPDFTVSFNPNDSERVEGRVSADRRDREPSRWVRRPGAVEAGESAGWLRGARDLHRGGPAVDDVRACMPD